MIKRSTKKNLSKASLWIGLFIVAITHLYMLFAEASMDSQTGFVHAIINLFAVALIVYYKAVEEKWL